MSTPFPLFPPSASTVALEMDLLYLFIAAVSAFFVVLVAALVVFFTIRFKRRHPDEVGADIHGSLALELTWTVIPFILSMIMFVWGADLFYRLSRPPADAMDIYVVGKRWMWKVQHPTGVREINQLHVPTGRSVRLFLGSEDVIHDFSIPAFRVKMDVVPGKVTTMWFNAILPGTYHLFCAEYCGTKHSGMVGDVIVMAPQDYEAWLSGGTSGESPAISGEKAFNEYYCVTCHKPDSSGRGPTLNGVFGSEVKLADGRAVVADENYLRESIMIPGAKVVAGYPPTLMPSFQGQISEEKILQIIAYIKTLKGEAHAPAPAK
jgi:cytochrome c oxidase subunit 2